MDDLCRRGFTCERSPGKEEGGSSWPAGAESGCKAAGASPEGTSRSRRCTEVEDLSSRTRHKRRSVKFRWEVEVIPLLHYNKLHMSECE